MTTETDTAVAVLDTHGLSPAQARKMLATIRRDILDDYWRMGYSIREVALEFLQEESLRVFFRDILDQPELSDMQKLNAVWKQLQKDLTYIKRERRVVVDPEQIEDALAEYVGREDRIYQQAWRDHDISNDVGTKLDALKIAQTSARNKAQALGVIVERGQRAEVNRKTRTVIGSPEDVANLANKVAQQLAETNQGIVALVEVEEYAVSGDSG